MRQPSQLSNQLYAHGQTVVLCVYAAVSFWHPDALLFQSGPLQLAGDLLCAAGLLMLALAFVPLRRVIQIEPRPRQGGELITSGIYRYLRHPIYSGVLLSVAGLWLKAPRLSSAIAALAVIVFLALKVRVEERFLLATYADYAQYRNRTWGLLPLRRGA